jgi:hypothetical protein
MHVTTRFCIALRHSEFHRDGHIFRHTGSEVRTEGNQGWLIFLDPLCGTNFSYIIILYNKWGKALSFAS